MMLDQLTAEEEAGGEDSQGLFSPPHTHTLPWMYLSGRFHDAPSVCTATSYPVMGDRGRMIVERGTPV